MVFHEMMIYAKNRKFPKPGFHFPGVVELQTEFLCNNLTLNLDFMKKNRALCAFHLRGKRQKFVIVVFKPSLLRFSVLSAIVILYLILEVITDQ